MRPWTRPTLVAEHRLQRREALLGRHQLDLLGFLDQRADPVDLLALGDGASRMRPTSSSSRSSGSVTVLDRLAAGRLFGQRETSMSPKAVSTSVRGIGVAVITSMSGASPLAVSARRWCTPKRCCSSTTASARSRKTTASWNSACVPTTMSIAPVARPARIVGALAALFAAGQDRGRSPAALGQRRDGREMLARQDFGRRHQRRLAAGLDRARHGEQRHHRLARADIALQQPQHALGLGQVGVDLGQRLFLRRGQRIGQGGADLGFDRAVAGRAAGRPAACVRWRAPAPARSGRPGIRHRRAAARRRLPARRRSGRRDCAARAARRRRRKGLPARQRRRPAIPAVRQPRQRLADGPAQHLARQARGQRIDRLDQRQAVGRVGQRDMVGMDHRRAAVEPFHAAADDDVLADRQRLFQHGCLAWKKVSAISPVSSCAKTR